MFVTNVQLARLRRVRLVQVASTPANVSELIYFQVQTCLSFSAWQKIVSVSFQVKFRFGCFQRLWGFAFSGNECFGGAAKSGAADGSHTNFIVVVVEVGLAPPQAKLIF